MLLDENFEKLDEKHVYCHYCDMGKSITLHRPNDGDRLWTHLNTALHISNKEKDDKSVSKRVRTTFISQYVNIDYDCDSQQNDDDLQCNINSRYKVCASLAFNESFNKRNRRMKTLIVQIDCLFLLKEGQEIPQIIHNQFNHSSDAIWLKMDFQHLYNVVSNTLKHRLGSTTSDALKNLLSYVTIELKDHSYHSLIKSYPALGQILQAVEANGLEDWIGKCAAFMIDKTMDEQRPVFFGMAQAVTKVLDKMECEVTSMRGIGKYNETGATIQFLRKKRNEDSQEFNIHGINPCVFEELIAIWRTAYNYNGPTICAKDQTKVAEMIEVCRTRQQWATYITVFALSAVLPGILPLVLAVIPSNQKETKADAFLENNTVLKELIKLGAKPIGLYFDGAAHDRSWIGKTYSKKSSVFNDLNLISDDTFFSKKFPIEIGILSDNGRSLINGTDVFHCVKKGRNMHNGGARICPIGNFIMSTEHLWYLKEQYGSKSGLTNEVLNPKDKQADELAERLFSSNNNELNLIYLNLAIVQHAIEHNDDSFYGDAMYHFFAGLLFESWKSRTMEHLKRIQFAWAATIFFAMTRHYLISNQCQRNSQKYGISWQSNDDFIYLGTILILLIHQFPNHYAGIPLCFWLISTAFLEHIFGYARRIIEDFTVLDFLMMNEKIIKTISTKMKENLIRPNNNDGYNIHLSTAKDRLPETLSDFLNIYDIDSNMIKVSKAMNSILHRSKSEKSGINQSPIGHQSGS
ncbi:hypothetical protein RirG_171690 [Rhizophagus irregularis DAOM 197198w]|uniref:Uncharacterized protein n=1 Tax=Rhizophagus irregularis (strain DAOM 197198w) TaxID=1432141 RepID=A0A015M3E8_RHIIW|nr:hypothetical protein RirG_171690 [Rhizophagus irregularis DAOM 197198w]